MLNSLFAAAAATTDESTASAVGIGLLPFLTCIAAALILGLLLTFAYSFRTRYTKSFVMTLAILPTIVAIVIALVNGNVGTGVAVAGAFSLVRFRSVAGNARDIGFVFLAMCVGLACGMGYLAYAAITACIVGGVSLIFQLVGFGSKASSDRTIRITVPEDLDYTGLFDDILARYTTYYEVTSVRTTNMGSLYRITVDAGIKGGMSERELIDELRTRNGNLEIALSRQETVSAEL